MNFSSRILIGIGGIVAAISTSIVLADTGSDFFNGEVALVQQNINMRNQLADDLVQSQLALGYSIPEIINAQNQPRIVRADGDAFGRAMEVLHRTVKMYAVIEDHW